MPTALEVEIAASLELNLLNSEGLLPGFEGLRIAGGVVPVGDIAGNLILKRKFLRRNTTNVGFFDIAANQALGTVLLHVGEIGKAPPANGDLPLELRTLQELWDIALQEHPLIVAGHYGNLHEWTPKALYVYSLPKLALAVDDTEGQRHLFDLGGWEEIPKLEFSSEKKSSMFGYSPVLDGVEAGGDDENATNFERRSEFWIRVAQSLGINTPLTQIDSAAFSDIRKRLAVTTHCEHIGQDIKKCLPPKVMLKSQVNGKWCVPASVLMALGVFQDVSIQANEIAVSLGLVDQLGIPRTLPPGGARKVDIFLDDQRELEAVTDSFPDWPRFESELANGRPIISLIQGHCRLVGGSSCLTVEAEGQKIEMRGLSVLDPWPVDVGRRLLWESFEPYRHEDNVVVMREPRKDVFAAARSAWRRLIKLFSGNG